MGMGIQQAASGVSGMDLASLGAELREKFNWSPSQIADCRVAQLGLAVLIHELMPNVL
jgi:hypothetical protein